jgi:hypothetical protein
MPRSHDHAYGASSALNHMAEVIQGPDQIDHARERGALNYDELVMTSVGNRTSAIITPYHPGIQFENKLKDRLEAAQRWSRPFVEAKIGFNPVRSSLAHLSLRLCNGGDYLYLLETAWVVPIEEESLPENTMMGVVAAIEDNAGDGYPVANRSGVVECGERRLKAGNWAISHKADPYEILADITEQMAALDFKQLD